MSTRCQIAVQGNSPVLIYRHSDGYPGSIKKNEIGVVPDIMPFCLEFIKHRGFDPRYLTASLTAYLKQWHCGEKQNTNNYHIMEVNGIKIPVLGHGIDCELHGDTVYLYNICKDGIYVLKAGTRLDNSKQIEFHAYSDYEMVDGVCKLKKD